MNILVTGGAGYIGSHACKALAAKGHVPITYDDLSRGNRWAVKWGPLLEGDIADAVRLRAGLEQYQPAALMHFSAYAYVGESVEKPLLYYRNNFAATASLLHTLTEFGCIPVVFSSSCAVYGEPERLPIPEDHPQRPINPYGHSKLFVERMLADLATASGLCWMALRYFNASGADPDGEIGEAHDPETHLVPLVLATALGRRAQIDIYGTDYPTPDGSAVRDYIHVQDLAEAHVAALARLLGGGTSLAVNLGTGAGHSVREVIDAAERITGRRIARREMPRRAGDPPVLVADVARAKALLGWSARLSDLDSILATA